MNVSMFFTSGIGGDVLMLTVRFTSDCEFR